MTAFDPKASVYEPPVIDQDDYSSEDDSSPPADITGEAPGSADATHLPPPSAHQSIEVDAYTQQIHDSDSITDSDDEVPASIQFEHSSEVQHAPLLEARRVANAILGTARPIFGIDRPRTNYGPSANSRPADQIHGASSWKQVKNFDIFLTRVPFY